MKAKKQFFLNISLIAPLEYHYEIVEEIHKGYFNSIHTAKNFKNDIYAVKITHKDERAAESEAEIMNKLSKFPNKSPFLTYYGLYNYLGNIAIVYEYFDSCNLKDIIKPINTERVCNIAKQIYQSLDYLFNYKMSHSNLDSTHILINDKDIIKLINISDHYLSSHYLSDRMIDDMNDIALILRELLGYAVPNGMLKEYLITDNIGNNNLNIIINRSLIAKINRKKKITPKEAVDLLS